MISSSFRQAAERVIRNKSSVKQSLPQALTRLHLVGLESSHSEWREWRQQETEGDLQEHLLFDDHLKPGLVAGNGRVQLIVGFHYRLSLLEAVSRKKTWE